MVVLRSRSARPTADRVVALCSRAPWRAAGVPCGEGQNRRILRFCAVEYGPEMAMWFRHSLNCAAINPPSITNSVMGSSKSPQVRGADKARTGREVKKFGQTSSFRPPPKAIPKWTVTEYKPPRKISVRAAPIQCSRRTRARAIFIITPFLSHAVVLARSLVARRTRSSRPRGKCFLTWTATAAVRSTRRSLA